jgi:hypothetical protein
MDLNVWYSEIYYARISFAELPTVGCKSAPAGDNSGDHWVAISSRTTDVKTQTTKSFGFYDPGTIRPDAGTHSSNKLKVNSNGSMSGTTNYNGKKYVVVNVRKNN